VAIPFYVMDGGKKGNGAKLQMDIWLRTRGRIYLSKNGRKRDQRVPREVFSLHPPAVRTDMIILIDLIPIFCRVPEGRNLNPISFEEGKRSFVSKKDYHHEVYWYVTLHLSRPAMLCCTVFLLCCCLDLDSFREGCEDSRL
jgi:hypothetical protein